MPTSSNTAPAPAQTSGCGTSSQRAQMRAAMPISIMPMPSSGSPPRRSGPDCCEAAMASTGRVREALRAGSRAATTVIRMPIM